MNMETDRRRDELLEMLWRLHEFGELTVSCLRRNDPDQRYEGSLREFSSNGMIRVQDDQIQFTTKGMKRAEGIVRRHRLAERLLVDVLGRTPSDTEEAACEFEHILAPELVEAICTLLGHPLTCPHGQNIPTGRCCEESRLMVPTAVVPLTQLDVGAAGRIASIQSQDQKRLARLLDLGLTPGTNLVVHQRYPALVVQVERRQIAFEESVGDDIRVWRKDGHA